jgi:cleavage stimulation factor subunit 1
MSRFHRKAGVSKEKEQLYRFIISQLKYDGFETAAAQLMEAVPKTALGSSERLNHLVSLGLQSESSMRSVGMSDPPTESQGIDLEYESDGVRKAVCPSDFEWVYNTIHKAPVWTAKFSKDGNLAASASVDTTIKVLDVERMMAKSQQSGDGHPVLRTLYDHHDAVTCLDFHPTSTFLASGSKDCTVKFFDHSKPAVKRASHFIQEVVRVNCIAFHPGGNYMMIGTDHPTLRLYDINTFQCFVSANAKDQHSGPITAVNYTPDARMYVSSSRDGQIRVWDGISNRCISVFPKAHEGDEVCCCFCSI